MSALLLEVLPDDTEDARLAQIEADYLSDEPRFPEFDDPIYRDPWEALSWD